MQSFLRKLLFAVYFKDPNIVLSPLLKPESRFLYFRDIRTRVTEGCPVPDARPGSLHGHLGREALLDPGRVHDERPVSLLDASDGVWETTSAIPSRWSLMPTTAPSTCTLPIRQIR